MYVFQFPSQQIKSANLQIGGFSQNLSLPKKHGLVSHRVGKEQHLFGYCI
jgi:hypothetical protein